MDPGVHRDGADATVRVIWTASTRFASDGLAGANDELAGVGHHLTAEVVVEAGCRAYRDLGVSEFIGAFAGLW